MLVHGMSNMLCKKVSKFSSWNVRSDRGSRAHDKFGKIGVLERFSEITTLAFIVADPELLKEMAGPCLDNSGSGILLPIACTESLNMSLTIVQCETCTWLLQESYQS